MNEAFPLTEITDYHAKYFANELILSGGTGVDRLGRALFDACVDLNPHQIEAASFALRSPLSKGVLLADEVGLGKTIEAGLTLCQCWAEKRRRLLVICPASLRKQWSIELAEKFNLPSLVLDAKTYRDLQKAGTTQPFQSGHVIICSMHFAASKAEELKAIAWDLVVIDEAHKLRNAYRQSNRIGQRIKWATDERKKLLLTATPLQNSLLELYGLATLIDERLFGDLDSFRSQYVNNGGDLDGLRDRLRSFCWRTLRSQVVEFIRYTERKPLTRPFKPSQQEIKLYQAVSAYLQRDDCFALPAGQKHLLILLVRKVLASSPYALAGTLEIMLARLIKMREQAKASLNPVELILTSEELDDDLLDELLEDEEDTLIEAGNDPNEPDEPLPDQALDLAKLDAEIEELQDYIRWANSIGVDSKTAALVKAINIGFEKMAEMGANRKAVIFTESKRSQAFLKQQLEANGHRVVTFNGTNADDASGQIYADWLKKNATNGRSSGSKQVDLRSALIDRFRDEADILIATEAGAEGINLQFCSLVINYDLPWNPQRIEQRIGRCHRYGQKHDVVVINFLNESNEADCRVFELLDQKFNLFSGVFGASDEVLGSIESGLDFEKRVLDIYQQCRTTEAIQTAFVALQTELESQIKARMQDTRKLLLEQFDEDVHERLNLNLGGAREKLDRIGRIFWQVTRHGLAQKASFDNDKLSFNLLSSPVAGVMPGTYQLISKTKPNEMSAFLYRMSHPLGEHVIDKAQNLACPLAQLRFDISNHPTRISVIEKLKGQTGWLRLQRLQIDSFERSEYLLFTAIDQSGSNLDQETCEKLFNCMAGVTGGHRLTSSAAQRLEADAARHAQATIAKNLEENNRHFSESRDQLDKWAEDMELATQKELDDLKRQIRELQRRSRQAPTLEEQHQLMEQIARLESNKRKLRQRIFDIEDEIAEKRDRLVEALEKRMQQKTFTEDLFTIEWEVV